jgi:hypothetical protein
LRLHLHKRVRNDILKFMYRNGYVSGAQSQSLNHMAHAQRQQPEKLPIELAAQCTQAFHMRRQVRHLA